MSAVKTEAPITIISSVDSANDNLSTSTLRRTGAAKVDKLGREFSRMSQRTKKVVTAAISAYGWQEWQNRKAAGALSYPRSAAFADGYKGTRPYGAIVPDLDSDPMPQEHIDLLDAVADLPEIRRKVFELTWRDGLEPSRVARKINGTICGVEHRLKESYLVIAGFLSGRGWKFDSANDT